MCLNVGCIPSKALLHAAKVIDETQRDGARTASPSASRRSTSPSCATGRTRSSAKLDRRPRRPGQAAQGRRSSTARRVRRRRNQLRGRADRRRHDRRSSFEHASSRPAPSRSGCRIPPTTRAIIDSTGALELDDCPQRLLVIGGGIIGLEMATVYHALGAKVTVVELTDGSCRAPTATWCSRWSKRIARRYDGIHLKTKVAARRGATDGLRVDVRGRQAPATATFDRVLVAVGRRPNGTRDRRGRAPASIVDERGFIPVDKQMRTNVPHIFAIGDIVGAADAGAQGDARGQGRGRGRRRAEEHLRRARRSRRSPTRIPRSPGSGSPRPRPRRKGIALREGRRSRGRRAAARSSLGPRRGAHQAAVRSGDAPASSAAASSARTRAT